MTTNGDEHYRDPYHSALPPSNNCADLTEEILEAGDNQYPIPYIGTPEAPNIFHAQGDTPAISFRYGLLYVLCAGVPGAVRGEYPFLISLTCQLIAAGCFYWVGRKHTRTAWIAAALITVAGCLWLVVMGSKAFRVRACYIVTFSWVLMLAVCVAGEPDRDKGLSVHVLPDRVAQ